MRLVLWVLFLFAAAVGIVYVAQFNSGSVLFNVPPYKVELTINNFFILLIVAFFIFYVLLKILARILGFSFYFRRKRINDRMLVGLKAFFEGKYDKAQKAAASALRLNSSPIINGINAALAARSAHKLEDYAARDQYLAISREVAPNEHTLGLITQAELLLEEGRHNEALDALHSLYSLGGLQSITALQLELKAQQMAQNWDAVMDLVNILANRYPYGKGSIEQLKHHAQQESIKKNSTNLDLLNKYWHSLNSMEQLDSRLAATAAKGYIALNDMATAQRIIEQSLDVKLDNELITLYSKCLGNSVSWQIQRAENWLSKNPNNAELLLTLGKLCTHCELWGKAQNYLEASLSIEPSRAAHLALAQLFEKLDKRELATDHYHKGLGFSLQKQAT